MVVLSKTTQIGEFFLAALILGGADGYGYLRRGATPLPAGELS